MYNFQTQSKDLKATPQELKTLLDIHLEMGLIPFPNMRLYRSEERKMQYKLIADAMTLNCFSMLKNNPHYLDNMQENNVSSFFAYNKNFLC